MLAFELTLLKIITFFKLIFYSAKKKNNCLKAVPPARKLLYIFKAFYALTLIHILALLFHKKTG